MRKGQQGPRMTAGTRIKALNATPRRFSPVAYGSPSRAGCRFSPCGGATQCKGITHPCFDRVVNYRRLLFAFLIRTHIAQIEQQSV
jgi:hypothetical protein